MNKYQYTFIIVLLILLFFTQAFTAGAENKDFNILKDTTMPWWFWITVLFLLCFGIGIVAVLGGVGGGVLFVPIVSGFFPFHFDFVRGTGLLLALSCALSAGPGLLRAKMVNLRLTMPAAFIASIFSIIGALIGLTLPVHILQLILGLVVIGVCILMGLAKKSEYPDIQKSDPLSQTLKIYGVYFEPSINKEINWKIHNTPAGLILFSIVGLLAGMFGLGAGWANVPVLNLVMGAPLKISVATSNFLLSITDSSAAWIYINSGCILPVFVVPSIVGIMLGSFIGARLLKKMRPGFIKWIVLGLLAVAGIRAMLEGLGIV